MYIKLVGATVVVADVVVDEMIFVLVTVSDVAVLASKPVISPMLVTVETTPWTNVVAVSTVELLVVDVVTSWLVISAVDIDALLIVVTSVLKLEAKLVVDELMVVEVLNSTVIDSVKLVVVMSIVDRFDSVTAIFVAKSSAKILIEWILFTI